jgi:hypothetical protein
MEPGGTNACSHIWERLQRGAAMCDLPWQGDNDPRVAGCIYATHVQDPGLRRAEGTLLVINIHLVFGNVFQRRKMEPGVTAYDLQVWRRPETCKIPDNCSSDGCRWLCVFSQSLPLGTMDVSYKLARSL